MRLSELMIKDFPEEAKRVYYAKKGKRVVWEHQPDCAESGDTEIYYCKDCNRYHVDAFERGWHVEPGRITDVVWLFDSDGDLRSLDVSCDVDSDGYENFIEAHSYQSRQNTWEEYYVYVLETGKDDVNNFIYKDENELKTRTEEALQRLKKNREEDFQHRKLQRLTKKCIRTPEGLVHEAVYSNTGYWKTACMQYLEMPDDGLSETITCLMCLATR